MTDKVVDASAIAAIIFDEPPGASAEATIKGSTLFASDLIGYELANVCVKKIRAKPEERTRLLEAFETYYDLGIREIAIDEREVIMLANDKRLSFYDASYLWLAQSLGVELVTFDERLAKAAQP